MEITAAGLMIPDSFHVAPEIKGEVNQILELLSDMGPGCAIESAEDIAEICKVIASKMTSLSDNQESDQNPSAR